MKTSPLDYLLSTLVLTLLIVLDVGLLAFFLVPLSKHGFGDYHVLVDGLSFLLLFGLLAALCYRIALRIHPLAEGLYAIEKAPFTYWKLLSVIEEFGRYALSPFTTVFARPAVAKLFGAQVGRDVAIAGILREPCLIHLGDYAIIGQNSIISGHMMVSGRIIIRPVRIGANVTIGANAIISPGVEIGAGSVVYAGALVTPLTKIPPGEEWGGNPACKIRNVRPADLRL
jgi:acetyltransferase-like isoleucine patch superfamily enzyme